MRMVVAHLAHYFGSCRCERSLLTWFIVFVSSRCQCAHAALQEYDHLRDELFFLNLPQRRCMNAVDLMLSYHLLSIRPCGAQSTFSYQSATKWFLVNSILRRLKYIFLTICKLALCGLLVSYYQFAFAAPRHAHLFDWHFILSIRLCGASTC